MSFVKNNKSQDYTDTVKGLYKVLLDVEYCNLRVSNIWKLLATVLGLRSFEILDPRVNRNGQFEAFLMDKQIDFMNGKDIDFTEIYDAILIVGEFTSSERLLLESGDIEERLWAIFLALTDKTLNLE